MYILTKGTRISKAHIEAYKAISETEITFFLASGNEITIKYASKESQETALANIDELLGE